MKYTIIFSLIIMPFHLNAQTWDEWFKQKETQKEYLIKQIAALKVYLDYLKEGYNIAKKGLNIIGDIRDGNFNDHSSYFGSLKLAKANVKGISKTDLITAYHVAIMRDFRALTNVCRKDGNLTTQEIGYVESVYSNLLTECERSIDALNAVITNDSSEMQDDERIERIDVIYEDMKDKYSFCKSFCNSTRMLMMQRAREQSEISRDGILNSGS